MRFKWNQLGGQLGMGIALVGLVFIFLGWNGAATYDRVPAQFPYLISGGIAGLCLVVIGAALIIVDNQRKDRATLQSSIDALRDAMDRLAAAQLGTTTNGGDGVVAGPTSYHRPDCRLLEGRGRLPTMAMADAEAHGLTACRVCEPGLITAARPRRRSGAGSRRR